MSYFDEQWRAAQNAPNSQKYMDQIMGTLERRAEKRAQARLYLSKVLDAQRRREAIVREYGPEDLSVFEMDERVRHAESRALLRGLKQIPGEISDLERLVNDEGALDDWLTYTCGWPT